MEVLQPDPPPGQQFILRSHMRRIFSSAPFEGEAWEACMAAFLAVPGVPLVMRNGVHHAPASFFLRLYRTREPTYAPEGHGRWGEDELRQRLEELGEQTVWLLLVSDSRRSWAIYLNEELTAVLAFHGRTLPGPRYNPEADDQDIAGGKVLKSLIPALTQARIAKLDMTSIPMLRVELSDESGANFELTFDRWRRVQHPTSENEIVLRVDEVLGTSGRTWFLFQPVAERGGRILMVQADSVSIRPL